MSNYSLEVISQHPTFRNKSLRKYYVDGIDTIGVWGDEPFEIKFTNNTWQKIQVKITLDGTDVLTGEPANTHDNKDMWVVNGYGTMTLKCWPETNNGGAGFVFTNANNSVAVHTHGDLSSRGIIAAAVYTEGHVEPIKVSSWIIQPLVIDNRHYPYNPYQQIYPIWSNVSYTDGATLGGIQSSYTSSSINNSCFNNSNPEIQETSLSNDLSLQSLAAVGAGQHVDQKISYAAGLIKPVLSDTIRVRYLWWDELVAKLKNNNVPVPHASGFPADGKKLNINLGNTPRIGNFHRPAFPREQMQSQPTYLRV